MIIITVDFKWWHYAIGYFSKLWKGGEHKPVGVNMPCFIFDSKSDCLGFLRRKQGSGTDRGRRPTELWDFPSIHQFFHPSPLSTIQPGLKPNQLSLRLSQPGQSQAWALGLAGWASGQAGWVSLWVSQIRLVLTKALLAGPWARLTGLWA